MSTIARQLPESIEKRLMALDAAQTKQASLPPGLIIISAATNTRLNGITTLYEAGSLDLGAKTSTSTNATSVKNTSQAAAYMWCSHYYQALNNAIERGVYTADVRNFFSLPANSAVLPDMDTEEKLKLWGERVSSGEALMVAAGNVAVGFPTEAQVKAKVDDYITKLTAQNVAMTATNTAQEALDALNDEADKVIKKVWDEVETYYNEETPESMRNSARPWGVKYATVGDPTQVTFKAERSDTHAPIPGVVFKMDSTGRTYTAGDEGTAELETRLIGDEDVKAVHPDFETLQLTITIVEGEAMTVTFQLVPAP